MVHKTHSHARAEPAGVVPRLGQTADAATSAGQQVTDAQQLVSTVTPAVAAALLLTATVLAVFKPWRR